MIITRLIDPSHGKRVTVAAPVVNDDGTTRDRPANPRKVDIYADIDAEKIYRSFWTAVE